jgi:hypothetical protein
MEGFSGRYEHKKISFFLLNIFGGPVSSTTRIVIAEKKKGNIPTIDDR